MGGGGRGGVLNIFILSISYTGENKENYILMNLSILLFIIGVLGFVLNRRNLIMMLISIEIMLLAITYLLLVSSINFDDILGQTYAIYIISVAGAETAIGLSIFVAFYRLSSFPISSYLSHTYPYVNNASNTKTLSKASTTRVAS